MGTRELVIRKGRIPHKMPVRIPVPANPEKEKVVLFPKPIMLPVG